MDVPVVRKVGHPLNSEFAIGALAEDGTMVLDEISAADVDDDTLARKKVSTATEIARRVKTYRDGEPLGHLDDATLVIIDDGVATGATMKAACDMGRAMGAGRIIAAVPVAPAGWKKAMRSHADEMVSLIEPDEFIAVSQFYRSFEQVTDDEVVRIRQALKRETVDLRACMMLDGGRGLPVHVVARPGHRAFVVFVHGSGSSMMSPRNTMVANALSRRGYSTMLFDLLTAGEGDERSNVFDIDLLAERTEKALEWLSEAVKVARRPTCLFGASTGAAAALVCAARHPEMVQAVISRGGRPDLARSELSKVACPVLLVVGGRDHDVLELNLDAAAHLKHCSGPVVVPGASHLFDEPGTLDLVVAHVNEFLTQLLG